MINLSEFNEKINLTVTKEDLQYFADQIIQKYTEQGHVTKYPAQMTISQVASYVNYSKPSIYKMVSSNSIPYYKEKFKGKLLFKKSEIDSWLKERRQSTVSEFGLQQEKKK